MVVRQGACHVVGREVAGDPEIRDTAAVARDLVGAQVSTRHDDGRSAMPFCCRTHFGQTQALQAPHAGLRQCGVHLFWADLHRQQPQRSQHGAGSGSLCRVTDRLGQSFEDPQLARHHLFAVQGGHCLLPQQLGHAVIGESGLHQLLLQPGDQRGVIGLRWPGAGGALRAGRGCGHAAQPIRR